MVQRVERPIIRDIERPVETIKTFKIDSESAAALRNKLLGCSGMSEREILNFASANADSLLSAEMRSVLEGFSRGKVGHGALHLKGFYIEGVAQTTALILANALGSPYIEKSESDRFVQPVTPSSSEATAQINASYAVPLEMHIENAGFNEPKFIVLLCERNEEQAETTVVSPYSALLATLAKGMADEALLRSDKFWVRAPKSFGRGESVLEGYRIITGDPENFHADFADVGSASAATSTTVRFLHPVSCCHGDYKK
jgi:hypothetical protein